MNADASSQVHFMAQLSIYHQVILWDTLELLSRPTWFWLSDFYASCVSFIHHWISEIYPPPHTHKHTHDEGFRSLTDNIQSSASLRSYWKTGHLQMRWFLHNLMMSKESDFKTMPGVCVRICFMCAYVRACLPCTRVLARDTVNYAVCSRFIVTPSKLIMTSTQITFQDGRLQYDTEVWKHNQGLCKWIEQRIFIGL